MSFNLIHPFPEYLELEDGSKLWFKTAAQLLALTENEVSVNDQALVLDQGLKGVEVDVTGPASTSWVQRTTEILTYANSGPGVTDLRYLYTTGTTWGTSISGEERLLVPYPGEVRRWVYSSSNDPGDTTLKVYGGDATASSEIGSIATPTDTTVVGLSGNYRIVADFAAANFTANQILAFSCLPSNVPGFTRGRIEIEVLVPLEA